MQKAVIALALVAVVLGVASANKLPSHRPHKQVHEVEFEHEPHHLEHHANNGWLEEHEELGHEGPHHNEHERHQGIRKHVPIAKPLHKAIRSSKRNGNLRGVAGAAVAGGQIREHEGHAANFEKGTHIADRKVLKNKKNFGAGEKKAVEADLQHHRDNEDAAIHKHQVLNKNKLIIKDQVSGVNDVDGFRHANHEHDSAHLAGAEGKFAHGSSNSKFASDKEFDRDVKAGVSSDEGIEASGFVGGVGAAGEAF